MPTWLQIAVGLVALLSFALSLFLAWLRWEERQAERQAKADLRLDMDWIVGGGPATLRIAAENRGKARGGVRNIILSPGEIHDPKTGFEFLYHLEELPVMLEPGGVERFPIPLNPNDTTRFTRGLLDGTFTHAILVDQDFNKRPFPIPSQPKEGGNRVSLMGYVRRR